MAKGVGLCTLAISKGEAREGEGLFVVASFIFDVF